MTATPDVDVPDVWIHEEWCLPDRPCPACVGEPRARIDAALAIHAPCHTADSKPYECTVHACPGCGRPDPGTRAVCEACTYDDREVPWPCPTATALGAVTPW